MAVITTFWAASNHHITDKSLLATNGKYILFLIYEINWKTCGRFGFFWKNKSLDIRRKSIDKKIKLIVSPNTQILEIYIDWSTHRPSWIVILKLFMILLQQTSINNGYLILFIKILKERFSSACVVKEQWMDSRPDVLLLQKVFRDGLF